MKWKPDWEQAKQNYIKWWRHEGMAVFLTGPRDEPIEPIAQPTPPDDTMQRWIDPVYRCDANEYRMSRTCFAAEAFPYLDTVIGPGDLGIMLGAEPRFDDATVWYEPCINDPDTYGPIHLTTENNKWLDVQMAIIDEGVRRAGGRYLVGFPDLIENIDTLAAMRDNQEVLIDLMERPTWVHECLAQINQAYFEAFDLIYDRVRDDDGGCVWCFRIWAPGKMAKVQCDAACMLSEAQFREFVVPYMTEQCDWLDYALFHLDGINALHHLDTLLGIESLDVIQWTPQAGRPQTGSPTWYDLYRRIKAGGKSVQAANVQPDEVAPLLDAVGPEGMYLGVSAQTAQQVDDVLKIIEQYR